MVCYSSNDPNTRQKVHYSGHEIAKFVSLWLIAWLSWEEVLPRLHKLMYLLQLQLHYPNLAGANIGTLTYVNVAIYNYEKHPTT